MKSVIQYNKYITINSSESYSSKIQNCIDMIVKTSSIDIECINELIAKTYLQTITNNEKDSNY